MKTTSRRSGLLVMVILAVAAPTASDADPRPTCRAACQRLTDCKLASYAKMCVDSCKQNGYESSEQGRAQIVTMTRLSCKQIQSAVAGMDAGQHQPSARGSSTRRPSPDNDDTAELDKLEKELNDLDRQLDNDSAELEKRSRGTRPVRGTSGPPRDPRAPAPGPGSSARSRPPAPSGSSRWTCNAEGLSVYGFNVESGGGDVRGRSTVSIPGTGGSKDEAARRAMSSCGSLMTTNLSTDRAMVLDASAEGQWGVRIAVPCHVTQCSPN